MSATNSTPNYGLPQYVADDKPTYLGDFNKAMLDIDTNMKSIDNKAVSAESAAQTANQNATQAIENSQTAQSAAEEAQASATLAKSTADTAKSTADTANTTANQTNTDISDWKTHDLSANGLTLHFAFNKKLNLLGVYGTLEGGSFPGGYQDMGVLPDDFLPKPTDTRALNNAGFIQATDNSTNAAQILIRNSDNMVRINTPSSKTWNYMYFQVMAQTSNWWE